METTPLRRLISKRQASTLLQAFAAAHGHPVTLGLAGAEAKWLAAHPDLPASDALVREVCETQQPAWDEDACAVPLVAEGGFCGVLYVRPSVRTLCEALSQVLGLLIASALSQKSLARETLDRYREINLLYRVHETIGSSVKLDEVIDRVLLESIHIIKAEGGSVLLADDLTDKLVTQGSKELNIGQAEQALMNQALSDKVFETGKPRILNDLDKYVRPQSREGVQLMSLLCAPLRAMERILGVITLGRTRRGDMFTAGDEKLLTALASQAGIAIANAREVEALERRLWQQIAALRIEIDETKRQREVYAITESEFFTKLQEDARKMRDEFDV